MQTYRKKANQHHLNCNTGHCSASCGRKNVYIKAKHSRSQGKSHIYIFGISIQTLIQKHLMLSEINSIRLP